MTIYQSTPLDRRLYDEQLRDFLPEGIFDFHCHLVAPGTMATPTPERLKRYWMLGLACEQSAEEFLATYEDLLPGKRIESLVFGFPTFEADLAAQNAYNLAAQRRHPQIHALYVARPEATEAELERAIEAGFLGFKPYPDFVAWDKPGQERIEQFLTPTMCLVADRHGALVMLHISKLQRFADPDNPRDLLALAERYPSLRLVIAHFGRAYNAVYLERALEQLGGRHPWWYDCSAVTNPETYKLALQAIPHDRICFGFDNPIMLHRGYYEFPTPGSYAVHIHGYNLDAPEHPPLAYQILQGFKAGAQAAGLSEASKRMIFYDNAAGLVGQELT